MMLIFLTLLAVRVNSQELRTARVVIVFDHGVIVSCPVKNERAVHCKLASGKTLDDVVNAWLVLSSRKDAAQ
jgi:hypothetical protein